MKRSFLHSVCVLACLGVSACGSTIGARQDSAQDIAAPAGLIRQDIAAGPFILASWQKITAPGAPINLYIEGDGSSWISRSTPSLNPTPKDPLALRLAALDPAPNVVYLARPCQFTQIGEAGNECDQSYWMSRRFAPEVIDSYDAALTGLSEAHGAQGYNLIGFSGGANVAGLVAERRGDILSLRTVAGNVDNDYFTQMHRVSAMPASLNMAARAQDLSALPQLHFIGEGDKTVPASVFESYRAKGGNALCVQSRIVAGATHMEGWAGQWPELLKEPVICR